MVNEKYCIFGAMLYLSLFCIHIQGYIQKTQSHKLMKDKQNNVYLILLTSTFKNFPYLAMVFLVHNLKKKSFKYNSIVIYLS